MIRVIRCPLPLSPPCIPSSLHYQRLPKRHPHIYLPLPPPQFLLLNPPYVVQSLPNLPLHLLLLLPLHCPDSLLSPSPPASAAAHTPLTFIRPRHLGYHPVGHREQRGLWAQAGHRSPSCPTGTPAQPGVHARRRGRTGACEESLFMLGLYTGGCASFRRSATVHSSKQASHAIISYEPLTLVVLPSLPP